MIASTCEDSSKSRADQRPVVGRALNHRNFRIFVVGQAVSVLGTWMQQTATLWLVCHLGQSSMLLGIADFTAQIPAALILPLAGVLTDRWNRHRTVMATQTLMMIQAFVLMALTVTGLISVWQVLALGSVLGILSALDSTARQAFMIDLVDRPDLGNAIAINSSVFNAARLFGPAIAGIVIGLCGAGTSGVWPCFLLNGLSYLAVLTSLLVMRVRQVRRSAKHESIVRGLGEGFAYVVSSMPIRRILILLGIVSMMSAPLSVLMPLLAKQVLHGGPYTYGMLQASVGAGALGASLFLAFRKSVIGLVRVIAVAGAAFGLGLAGISFSHSLPLSMAILVATGFAMITQMAASNAVLQTIVEEDKRGRAMSFFTLAFFGMGPIGSLVSGALADRIGILPTFLTFGLICLAASACYAALLTSMGQAIHPMYVRAGVLREAEMPVSRIGATTLGAIEESGVAA